MDQLSHIADYYNNTNLEYNLVLGRWRHQSMHYGYFDKNHHHFKSAITNMNRVISQKAGIKAGMHVLDADCGVGGTAIWLAQNLGCHVTGINIIPHQVHLAQRSADKHGLTHLVNFQTQDYTHTNFPNNHFDIVLAQESLSHCPQKPLFLKEAFRILKPNGKLVVADYCTTKTQYQPAQQQLIDTFCQGWAMPNLPTVVTYRQWLVKIGLTKIHFYNISTHVLPFSRWLAHTTQLLLPLARIAKFFRIMNQSEIKNAQAAIAQYQTLRQNLWQHTIFTAQKP